MKLFSILCLAFFIITTSCDSPAQKTDTGKSLKVFIIRHAEKPSDGDNLCPKGLDRANLLPAVLEKIVGIPDHTYIPQINTGKTTRRVRMLQTITPFAVAHNLTLNSSFGSDEVKKAADDILKKTGKVLVVWEHSNIPALAKALGVKGKLKWDDEDYDSIWIIDFKKDTAAPELKTEQENIIPKGVCN